MIYPFFLIIGEDGVIQLHHSCVAQKIQIKLIQERYTILFKII